MIDVHCHLNSERLHARPDEVVAEALAAGVVQIVMAGVSPACWDGQAALASRHRGVAAPVFGVHPWRAGRLTANELAADLDDLEGRLRAGPDRPVALGETGLDGSRLAPPGTLDVQEHALRAHLELARRHQLPVVLHLLRAHDRALRVLKEVGVPPAGALVHSFSGSAEIAREYVRLGLHISFCGTVTLAQSSKLRRAAASVPADRLLVETDAPDQPPHPHRGRPNRPAWLPLVVAGLAAARGEPADVVAETTARNATRLLALA